MIFKVMAYTVTAEYPSILKTWFAGHNHQKENSKMPETCDSVVVSREQMKCSLS